MKTPQPDPEVDVVMQAAVQEADLIAVLAVKGVMMEVKRASNLRYQEFPLSSKA